jgi:hypothetical protein
MFLQTTQRLLSNLFPVSIEYANFRSAYSLTKEAGPNESLPGASISLRYVSLGTTLNIDQKVITKPIRSMSSILQQTEALTGPVSLVRTLYFTMRGITVYYQPLNSVVKIFFRFWLSV